MLVTYNTADAQKAFPQLLKQAKDQVIAIVRRRKTLAYIVSLEKLESLVVTAEIRANPKAMKAIRDAQQGRTKYFPLPKHLDSTTKKRTTKTSKPRKKSKATKLKPV